MQFYEIDISKYEDQLNKLRKAQFEVQAYENILKFLSSENDDIDFFLKYYSQYMEDYVIALMDLEDCKEESIKIFLSEYKYENYSKKNWSIDFNNEILKIGMELKNEI